MHFFLWFHCSVHCQYLYSPVFTCIHKLVLSVVTDFPFAAHACLLFRSTSNQLHALSSGHVCNALWMTGTMGLHSFWLTTSVSIYFPSLLHHCSLCLVTSCDVPCTYSTFFFDSAIKPIPVLPLPLLLPLCLTIPSLPFLSPPSPSPHSPLSYPSHLLCPSISHFGTHSLFFLPPISSLGTVNFRIVVQNSKWQIISNNHTYLHRRQC